VNAAQRQQLAGLRHRVGLDAAKQMVATMERIDRRRAVVAEVYRDGRRIRAARHARTRELVGACFLILTCLAVAVFFA
jgi:hypothetical protein